MSSLRPPRTEPGPELLLCGCSSASVALCPLSVLPVTPLPFAVQSVAAMAKQRRALRRPTTTFAPSSAGGSRHHVVRTVQPANVPWPRQEFSPCHLRRVANAAAAAGAGPARLHSVSEPASHASLQNAAQRVAARHPFISHVQLAVAIQAARFARPRSRRLVPQRSAAVAAHSRLHPAAFAAEVGFHPNAAYLAEVAEYGCNTGFTAGTRVRFCDNHPSAFEHSAIIDADVALGLQNGHVIDVTDLYYAEASMGCIVSPLSVVFHPRTLKPRVVTDATCYAGSCTNESCDPTNLPHTRLHTIVSMQTAQPHNPVLLQNYDLRRA